MQKAEKWKVAIQRPRLTTYGMALNVQVGRSFKNNAGSYTGCLHGFVAILAQYAIDEDDIWLTHLRNDFGPTVADSVGVAAMEIETWIPIKRAVIR